jgi:hypothetical protein
MSFISPKNVLVDFMRINLTDPRARAETTNTETFDGGGTDFQLTPTSGSLSCITSVKISSVEQVKWKDYYIDFQNEKVIFYSTTTVGVANIAIVYKQGSTNWIYPDKAKKTLSKTAFPRINVLVVGGTGDRLGQVNSDMDSRIHFQIDVWSKENQLFTISGINYEGDKLGEYLSYEITRIFKSNSDDLHPALFSYALLGVPRDLGFDKEMECFHKVVEVEFEALNSGEDY